MLKRFKRSISKNLDRTFAKVAVKRGLFDGIDVTAVAAIAQQFEGHLYQKYYTKMEHTKVRNAARIYGLGINKSSGLRVLDIGSGFGYFAFAAQQHGHKVIGLDLDDPFFNKVAPVLGIERVLHRIERFEPLPEIPGAPFDLITAFAPMFDHPTPDDQWGNDEWSFFLRDLMRFMAPGCRVYVKFNQYRVNEAGYPNCEQPMPDELVAHLESLGATFSKRTMDIDDAPVALASLVAPGEPSGEDISAHAAG